MIEIEIAVRDVHAYRWKCHDAQSVRSGRIHCLHRMYIPHAIIGAVCMCMYM